jgi:hypothetical protein
MKSIFPVNSHIDFLVPKCFGIFAFPELFPMTEFSLFAFCCCAETLFFFLLRNLLGVEF